MHVPRALSWESPTGAWIEGDELRTLEAIRQWSVLPDHASVNLSESNAPAVMTLLREKGIGIEVGLASVADAERYIRLEAHERVFRILIELDNEQELQVAFDVAKGIGRYASAYQCERPILMHGFDVIPFGHSCNWPKSGNIPRASASKMESFFRTGRSRRTMPSCCRRSHDLSRSRLSAMPGSRHARNISLAFGAP